MKLRRIFRKLIKKTTGNYIFLEELEDYKKGKISYEELLGFTTEYEIMPMGEVFSKTALQVIFKQLKSIQIKEYLFNKDSMEFYIPYYNMFSGYYRRGEYLRALKALLKARKIYKRNNPSDKKHIDYLSKRGEFIINYQKHLGNNVNLFFVEIDYRRVKRMMILEKDSLDPRLTYGHIVVEEYSHNELFLKHEFNKYWIYASAEDFDDTYSWRGEITQEEADIVLKEIPNYKKLFRDILETKRLWYIKPPCDSKEYTKNGYLNEDNGYRDRGTGCGRW